MSVQDLKGQLQSAIDNIGGSDVTGVEQRWHAAAQQINAAAEGTGNSNLSTAAAQLLAAADQLNKATLVTQLVAGQITSYMASL